jgi:hypothetical protein
VNPPLVGSHEGMQESLIQGLFCLACRRRASLLACAVHVTTSPAETSVTNQDQQNSIGLYATATAAALARDMATTSLHRVC